MKHLFGSYLDVAQAVEARAQICFLGQQPLYFRLHSVALLLGPHKLVLVDVAILDELRNHFVLLLSLFEQLAAVEGGKLSRQCLVLQKQVLVSR